VVNYFWRASTYRFALCTLPSSRADTHHKVGACCKMMCGSKYGAYTIALLLLSVRVFAFVNYSSWRRRYTSFLHLSATDDAASPIQLLSAEKRNEIETLVQQRSEARWNGNYKHADELRDVIDQICVTISLNQLQSSAIDLENDIEYKVVTTDLPRSEGGGSTWELQPINNPLFNNAKSEDNVLQLAHAALGMVVSASERGVDVNEEDLDTLVSRIEARLQTLQHRKAMATFFPGTAAAGELHGRKAADAAFWLSLAGVNTPANLIYDELAKVASEELIRFGSNKSCRAKDVLHIVERFAMAGVTGPSVHHLYNIAADCLEVKMMNNATDSVNDSDDGSIDYNSIIKALRGDSTFGLHSDRSLLGLWRFSTRQRKQRVFFENAAKHFDGRYGKETTTLHSTTDDKSDKYEWSKLFKDPTRPLVVDVGCGMGVSLLGLAKAASEASHDEEIEIDWNKCNFLGVDLSRLGIRFARGVSKRWKLDNLKFVVDPAEDCVEHLSSYPGPIQLAMIQFPTPYRYTEDRDDVEASVAQGYNAQLPEDSESGCFMVTEKLLRLIQGVLSREQGRLVIQSNCEDVAVRMKTIAESKAGFKAVAFANSVTSLDAVTQRAQRWVANGGDRAIGKAFSSLPLLPMIGRTETEVACSLDGKPVHRCLFVPRD
jgi:SAM-dependent methyltransferase